ncbi:MAG: hypothetical protein QM501_09115 [Gimesia sp.]
MVCTHLKELYQLCEKNQLKIAGSDLVHIICKQCDEEETCPSIMMDEYDSKFPKTDKKAEPKSESE